MLQEIVFAKSATFGVMDNLLSLVQYKITAFKMSANKTTD